MQQQRNMNGGTSSNGTLARQSIGGRSSTGSSVGQIQVVNHYQASENTCEVNGCFNPVDIFVSSSFCRNCLMEQQQQHHHQRSNL